MKWMLSAVLVLISQASFAENWIRYTQTPEANRYYDRERLLVMSGTAFIWDMHDLKGEASGDGKRIRSVLYAVEVNCRKEQRRVRSSHRMSGAMGAGQMVDEVSLVSEWSAPDMQSPERQLMAIACDQ